MRRDSDIIGLLIMGSMIWFIGFIIFTLFFTLFT